MKKLHFYIFHYHLLPGGVTDVIMGWLQLIAAQQIFPGREVVTTVLCGSPDNVAELRTKFPCQFIVDENLAYSSGEQQTLAELLLQKYRGGIDEESIWWVHNYHLGKNVAFTKALLEIIARQSGPNILLHIHDFPECGRFANYSNLIEALGQEPLYPLAPNVCYATINKRDCNILQNAGIPQERLFFLPNPLQFNDLQTSEASELRQKFAEQFTESTGARYAAEKPIALYPVRCIRRKNVLELGALNLLAGEPWNIVCTLPGRSEREKPYSDLVAHLFRQGLIQGRCEVGVELDSKAWSFDMLCAASELILCSSVMEGFGFSYFNPMYWNKALVARRLDVLAGFDHCFPGAIFYRDLKIPLRGSTLNYQELRRKYLDYIATLPLPVAADLSEALKEKLPAQAPPYLDFAFLTVGQQVAILQRLRHSSQSNDSFLQSCRECNRELLADLQNLGTRQKQGSREIVLEEFAPDRLAGILQEIVACFEQDFPKNFSPSSVPAIDGQILRSFSKLEYNYAILWDEVHLLE